MIAHQTGLFGVLTEGERGREGEGEGEGDREGGRWKRERAWARARLSGARTKVCRRW